MEIPLFVLKPKYWNMPFLSLIGLLCATSAIFTAFGDKNFYTTSPYAIFALYMGMFACFAMGIWFLHSLFFFDMIVCYQNRIEITPFFKKQTSVIYFQDIESWVNIDAVAELHIYHSKGRYCAFNTYFTDEYSNFKDFIMSHFPRKPSEAQKVNKRIVFIVIYVGLILLFLLLGNYETK